mmetsp:Transcript_36900/g.56494  ORF Transcript_36900/g.56494 Transcript_36900/m.56494 type:complete len:394 (+) Transcript_36900:815-1996(+)
MVEEVTEEPAPEVEVPQVREKKDIKMDFTERKFANLPARESHFKEAPYPKSKKIDKKADDVYIDIEDKDPLWLKDKGDHFYERNDYHSALNAYSKSIENDKEFLMSRLNRATTFIRMRWFPAAVDECDDIEKMVNAIPEKERQEDQDYYLKMLARSFLKRGAAQAWLSQFDAAVSDFKKAMEFKGLYSEKEIEAMQRDIDAILLRKESQELKLEGDILFARNMLDESLAMYEKSLEKDPHNEYAMSNIGVIYLKRQSYEECLEFSTRALHVIELFQSDTKEFHRENTLEIKLLQRRAKCYEVKGKYELAKEDLDRAFMLDRENPAVRQMRKTIQDKLDTISFEEYRKLGDLALKEKDFERALIEYDKCLRITRKATTLDNVAIYVNRIACLLS